MALRKLHPNHKSAGPANVIASLLRSRLSACVTIGIILILIVTGTVLLYYQLQYTLLQTKTIAGDNLRPTPWHTFHLESPDPWSRAARLPTMIKCNYLSCLSHSLMPRRQPRLSDRTHSCPDYFQWIYEDLAPWRENKITQENLQDAQKHAAFRVVIVGGRLYTEFYYACVLPRAMFTLWGLLQLLEKYPGMVPDVDLMFDCMDRPAVLKNHYKRRRIPPPLFRYCSNKDAFDIPFPDWSFWGWPQISLLPWAEEIESIVNASKTTEWEKRDPNAYWKGNPDVGSKVREELLKCNSTEDWHAQIFRQNWWVEAQAGYKNSKLSEQCKHRFKIYTEGHAWSVSFKYIFACDSPVLVASPTYHEFFTRGLIPMVHFWPIRRENLCPSIKFAVDWGNQHLDEARAIGKSGQEFMWRNLTMDNVYDYMFHLLSEYAKLQNFRPVVPASAQILCKSAVLCFTDDHRTKDYLLRSEAKVSEAPPCSMSPRDPSYISGVERLSANTTSNIWNWENAARKEAKT